MEPPNGWRFVEPATGTTIGGDFLAELTRRVREHREWMNQQRPLDQQLVVDPVKVQLEVERQICIGLEEACVPEAGENVTKVKDQFRTLNSKTIMAASHALFDFLAGHMGMCSPEESSRRATICRGCKFNRLSGTCMCTLVWKTLDSLVPKHRREGGLKVCGVCGCTLVAKVVVPDSTVEASNAGQNLVFPSWCWQNSLNGDQIKAQ